MTKASTTPTSLIGCIDHLADEVYIRNISKSNATLDLLRNPLTRDYENQMERMAAYPRYAAQISLINRGIAQHGISQFISLVQTAEQASIAIALNAGDGIVVKITDKSYLHSHGTIVPCQLPPIYRNDVDGFVIEIFPWVNRKNMRPQDIDDMKEHLKKYGLRFKSGDDRPDNIGRMPNRELVVLDGDALEPIPDAHLSTEQMQGMQDKWMQHVQQLFFPLYTDPAYASGEKSLIRDQPDFTEQFSPLIQKLPPHREQPPQQSIFERLFGQKPPEQKTR